MKADTSISVRAGNERDVQDVLEVERASFPYPYSPAVFEEFLKENAIFLIAEGSQGILGYVAADVVPGGRGLIISIAVHPHHRLHGIGSRLMCEALSRMRNRCSKVMLHVATKNDSGQAFYIRLGFKPIGLIKRYYPDGDDAIILENTTEDVIEKVCSRSGRHLSQHD